MQLSIRVKEGLGIGPAVLGILVLCLCLLEFSCTNTLKTAATPRITCSTLILVYMDADNSLNDEALVNMAEMEKARTKGNARLLALIARTSDPTDSEDDWNEARLYEMSYSNGDFSIKQLNCPELGLDADWTYNTLDMGVPSTLEGYLSFASKRYSPGKTDLILWDHGGGWRSGQANPKEICSDDTSGHALSLPQVRAAITGSGLGQVDQYHDYTLSFGSSAQ